MKRLLIVILILAPLSGAFGRDAKRYRIQDILVFAGASLSQYSKVSDTLTLPWGSEYLNQRNNVGATAGLGYAVPLNKHLSIDVRLQYMRKGTRVDWLFMDEEMRINYYRLNYSLDTLSNSTTFKYKPFSKSPPYVLGGFDLSWMFAYHVTYATDGLGSNTESLDGQTKDIDFGLIAGAGVEFSSQKLTPFVEVRYHLGLLNLSKGVEPFAPLRTRALTLLAGIKIRLRED